jgi:hypothetical protein
MTNLITGILGMSLVLIFLGILVFWLKALPMIVIMLCVCALMGYDFWTTVRDGPGGGPYRRP